MKIQIASDLHLEFDPPDNGFPLHKTCADVVILAGDIHDSPRTDVSNAKRNKWKQAHQGIVQILGNHEYYHSHSVDILPINKRRSAGLWGNELVIIKVTLWSYLDKELEPKITKGMNDFRVPGLTPEWWVTEHKLDVNFIERKLFEATRDGFKKVVVTHHAPSYRSIHSRYEHSDLNSAFATNLEWMFDKPWSPDLWVHGHVHDSFDYTIGKTRIICNPRGYPHEPNPKFNPALVVEI